MNRTAARERIATRVTPTTTYHHVDTTDTRAVTIAKKFYAECFQGYYGREWDALPVSQQYRFIRAGYQVLDLTEDWT